MTLVVNQFLASRRNAFAGYIMVYVKSLPENLAHLRFVSSPAESHPVLNINLFIRTFKIEYWYREQMDGPCFAAFKPKLGKTWEEASSSNVCRCSFLRNRITWTLQQISIAGLISEGFITDHHYRHQMKFWSIETSIFGRQQGGQLGSPRHFDGLRHWLSFDFSRPILAMRGWYVSNMFGFLKWGGSPSKSLDHLSISSVFRSSMSRLVTILISTETPIFFVTTAGFLTAEE